ncbi:hypothetical protein M404DRAFT_993816 [Pisolithus tinctorius Marx 270]|uniref:Uncharacterized protein n=1 Tax=Pisolithus tinctorius Marx 270 TaxID=870435 RepID=A0A0C3KTM9_PISTI|nr:hypothetical protein M404DRAFT_993816 [Pisolithus tinctorius Marx 270]
MNCPVPIKHVPRRYARANPSREWHTGYRCLVSNIWSASCVLVSISFPFDAALAMHDGCLILTRITAKYINEVQNYCNADSCRCWASEERQGPRFL